VNGLIGSHSYSILRAVEHKGKKFVVVRNPWGDTEWTGPWSDGSKEWSLKWLDALPVLNHSFGNDGQFVIECEFLLNFLAISLFSELLTIDNCFLDNFDYVIRTRLFDSSWTMSSQWLEVTSRPLPSPLAYGDVSCNVVRVTIFKDIN
jgi:hypothetical protein